MVTYKSVILSVIAIVLLPISGVFSQDEPTSTVADFNFSHTMKINGEEEIATGVGTVDLATGIISMEASINSYIPGYAMYAASAVTSVGTGGGGTTALIGMSNDLDELIRNGFTYSATGITRDEYADLTYIIEVTLSDGLMTQTVISEGTADYPVLIGMDGPVQFTQVPTENGFVEIGTKRLITWDGTIISSQTYTEFADIKLPQPQRRLLGVDVNLSSISPSLSLTENFSNLDLTYKSEVTPLFDS